MNKSRSELPAPLPASVLGDGTERYDVVVIGFGIAGGSAALEAARAGVRVLLLERAAVHGGTTCMAGGHFYLGGGTAVQQATGHEDSAEEMYKYLLAVSKEPEHDKIRAYCEGSVEHFGWLESLGFEFERSYFPDKAVIQPGTEGLMFSIPSFCGSMPMAFNVVTGTASAAIGTAGQAAARTPTRRPAVRRPGDVPT